MGHERYQSCIEACNTCADSCDYCFSACLREDDVKMMAECIRLDMDCAAICRIAASYMARESTYAGELCACCAEVCEAAPRSAQGTRSRTAKNVRERVANAQRSADGWWLYLEWPKQASRATAAFTGQTNFDP